MSTPQSRAERRTEERSPAESPCRTAGSSHRYSVTPYEGRAAQSGATPTKVGVSATFGRRAAAVPSLSIET
ncbi:hypothetical protein GCM10010485_66080 [Streptosporangium carneum]